MKKVFLLIIVLAIITGAVYFLVNKKEFKTDFIIPSPSDQIWHTYTNDQYGFEFKYPPNLVAKLDDQANSPVEFYMNDNGEAIFQLSWYKITPPAEHHLIELTVTNKQTTAEAATKYKSDAGRSYSIFSSGPYTYIFKIPNDELTSDAQIVANQILSTFRLSK